MRTGDSDSSPLLDQPLSRYALRIVSLKDQELRRRDALTIVPRSHTPCCGMQLLCHRPGQRYIARVGLQNGMSKHFSNSIASNLTTRPQRPHARAPALNVTIQDGFSNGYIFMSPYSDASAPAPYIYDKFGNLVWDGYGAVGAANAHNFHVCSYQGVDHLCMMVGNQQEGLLTSALHFSRGGRRD